jgi:6-phosphogluconolactonase (cycloisomerase 2 family)
VGAVYAGTNNNGPAGNFVVGFGRRADGSLVPLDAYGTGGDGRAAPSSSSPRLNSLAAEDSIIAVNNRFLIVVNAGSNNITSFRINADFSLTRLDIEASGGTSPVSLAYRNGIVYVAHADEDGVFTGPANQSGNITAMRLEAATGQLTPIAGFSVSLRARPADLEVTPDGAYLIASALNAGSPALPQPTGAEVSSFRIQTDGTLTAAPAGTGMSTQLNNPEGRNLPNAIGIETYARDGKQFVIAAEARTVSSTGVPAANFSAVQTGSVSTWEIAADGTLMPRTQDFRLGPTLTSGPSQPGFIAYSPSYELAMVASTSGARLSGLVLGDNGAVQLSNGGYMVQGKAVDPSSSTPLADADGFVDVAFSPDGNFLYHVVGLRGRIDVYGIVFSLEQRQQLTTGLLPMDNLQGLVVVGPAQP